MSVDGTNQWHDSALDLGEQALHPRGRQARLGEPDERIVRTLRITKSLREAAGQIDCHLHGPRKQRPLGASPGLEPDGSGRRAGACHLRHQVSRHLDRLLEVAPRHPYEAGSIGLGGQRCNLSGGAIQQLRHLRRREALVSEPAERRQLVGAVLHPAWWHVGLLVPAQHRTGPLQVGDLAQHVSQALEPAGGRDSCHAGTLSLRLDGAAGSLASRPAASSIGRRYWPVYDAGSRATCSGVPSATSCPPRSPPSGPRSISQSAVLSTSRLCSITITVLPLSTRRCSTVSSRSTSK